MPHSDELTEEVRSLFCNNVLDDPYPLYRRVREQSAFFEIDDFIIVTRHPHVREVYSDSAATTRSRRFSGCSSRRASTPSTAASATSSAGPLNLGR